MGRYCSKFRNFLWIEGVVDPRLTRSSLQKKRTEEKSERFNFSIIRAIRCLKTGQAFPLNLQVFATTLRARIV